MTKSLPDQWRFCLYACLAGTFLAYLALFPLWRSGLYGRSALSLLVAPPLMFGWIALCLSPMKGGWLGKHPLVPGLLGSLVVFTVFLLFILFQL